ncbi:hypothetical protein BACPU_30610 [Bacillus pumilus]|nr:hypothetical protein BACPU_30610 [Bacillus pumilus]
MQKIKKFHVDLTKNTEVPFFQVPSELRIRFGVELFENGNLHLLKDIINNTLHRSEQMDVTFLSGYMINDRRYREKTNIGKYIKIKNWSETIVYRDEINANVIFASIQDVRFKEVYPYIKSIVKGMNSPFIVFYQDSYLVYVSEDVIDIISNDRHLIQNLKNQYQEVFDTYYENR